MEVSGDKGGEGSVNVCVAGAGAAFDEGCCDGARRGYRRKADSEADKAACDEADEEAIEGCRDHAEHGCFEAGRGGKAPMKGKRKRYVHSYITMSIAEHHGAMFDEGSSDGWRRGCGREADYEADEAG